MMDITSNRHHNNPASRAAFERGAVHFTNDRELVYALLADAMDGLTSKEIAAMLGRPVHTLSGRLSELKRDGKVRGTGTMRGGAEVLTVVRPATQLELLEVA